MKSKKQTTNKSPKTTTKSTTLTLKDSRNADFTTNFQICWYLEVHLLFIEIKNIGH